MSVQQMTTYSDVASWELSDSFWERIKPLLPKPKSRFRGRGKKRKNIGGRPAADARKIMAGILYVLRTGCHWKAVPREFGSGSVVHRGAATGKNPTDRGKSGTKRSLLVEGRGVPIAIVVDKAGRHDLKLLAKTLDARVVETEEEIEENLCLDKAYSGEPAQRICEERGYRVHVPDKVNAKEKRKRKSGRRKARRWRVEVTHSWLNRFRRLLVRWEKKLANYLSMLYFACAIICWRKCEV
jgi:putative transposase